MSVSQVAHLAGVQLLSLRAEWIDPSDRYTLAVYSDNVNDEEYRTMAQANATGIGAGWGTPATMGVSIRATFQERYQCAHSAR